jgi:hypothetical protein
MNDFSNDDLNPNHAAKPKSPQAKPHRWNVNLDDTLDDTLSPASQSTASDADNEAAPAYRPARVRGTGKGDIASEVDAQTAQMDEFIQSIDEKQKASGEPGAAAASAQAATPSRISWMGLGALALALVAGWALFVHYLYAGDAKNKNPQPSASYDLPITGQLVSLSAVQPTWRYRTETDKTKAATKVLPTLTLENSASSSASGWLRVLFHDDAGAVRGDVPIIEVKGGRFVDAANPLAKVSADGKKITFSASDGFDSEITFTAYRYGIDQRWSAKIEETTDAARTDWKMLSFIELGQTLAEAQP